MVELVRSEHKMRNPATFLKQTRHTTSSSRKKVAFRVAKNDFVYEVRWFEILGCNRFGAVLHDVRITLVYITLTSMTFALHLLNLLTFEFDPSQTHKRTVIVTDDPQYKALS